MRSLKTGRHGLDAHNPVFVAMGDEELERACRTPTPDRLFAVAHALARGITVERLYEITAIDPWFLDQMAQSWMPAPSSRRWPVPTPSIAAPGGGRSGSAS